VLRGDPVRVDIPGYTPRVVAGADRIFVLVTAAIERIADWLRRPRRRARQADVTWRRGGSPASALAPRIETPLAHRLRTRGLRCPPALRVAAAARSRGNHDPRAMALIAALSA
jgi:hypothetical protein